MEIITEAGTDAKAIGTLNLISAGNSVPKELLNHFLESNYYNLYFSGSNYYITEYYWLGSISNCTGVAWQASTRRSGDPLTTFTAGGSPVSVPASCSEPKLIYRKAEFNSSYFSGHEDRWPIVAEGNPLGHNYEKTYEWDDDEHSCTAKAVCKTCDETITKTIDGIYVKDTNATITANEKGHYIATFTDAPFSGHTEETTANSYEVPNSKIQT